jgi:hypothetical protein
MKKLNKEEAAKAGIINHGNNSKVSTQLMELEIGEAVIIEKGIDWKSKSTPYRIVIYFTKKTGRKFVSGLTTDKKGWIIKRIS